MDNSNKILVIIKNKLYDVTFILDKHPGGNKCILNNNGKDIYRDYKFHSKQAKKLIKQNFIKKLNKT